MSNFGDLAGSHLLDFLFQLNFAKLSVIDVAVVVLRQTVKVAESERALAVCPQEPDFLIAVEAA